MKQGQAEKAVSTQTAGALPASRPRELADVSPPRAGSPVGQTKGEVPRSAVSHANDKQELREDSLEKHSVGGQRPCPHPRRRGRGAGRGRASPGAQGPGAGSGGLLTCRGPRASCNARRLFRSTDQGVSGGPGPLWLQPQDTVHQVSLGERNWDKCWHGLNSHVERWSHVLKYPEHFSFKGDTSLSR